MDIKSKLTLKEFRSASYYGLFIRNESQIKVFLIFLAAAVVYMVLGEILKVVPYYPILMLICVAYFVVFLIKFGNTDRAVAKYAKSSDSFIGKEFYYRFTDTMIYLEIPSKGIKNNFSISSVPVVFESSYCFMMYINAEQVFLISKSSLASKQISFLRDYFALHLKSNFVSKSFADALRGSNRRNGQLY